MPTKNGGETKSERERRGLRERRNKQLAEARAALATLKGDLSANGTVLRRCAALSDHSLGFYEEIARLAKGKALMAVTDLMVAQANDIIRDAKTIVTKDVHLDRIKEFVPAGDNPIYPDVLVTIRSVRDSLVRFNTEFEVKLKRLRERLQTVKNVIGALEYFLDDENDDEENEKSFPTRDAVREYVNGPLIGSCFFHDSENDEDCFDFYKLDQHPFQEYLSMNDDDAESQGGRQKDSKVADSSEAEEESEDEDNQA